MNELKFRAYHKERGKHYEVVVINLEKQFVTLASVEGYKFPQNFDEVIIEQYTGMEDKNGKELFINDKVTFRQLHRKQIEVGYIVYHNGVIWVSNLSGMSDEYRMGVYDVEIIGYYNASEEDTE